MKPWQQCALAVGPVATLVMASLYFVAMLVWVSCSAVKTYGPPVLDSAMRHFVEALEKRQVAVQRATRPFSHLSALVAVLWFLLLCFCKQQFVFFRVHLRKTQSERIFRHLEF